MGKLNDLTGKRFGRLTVIKRGENSKHGNAKWICNCDCGKRNVLVFGKHLCSGHTKSCGCIRIEAEYNKTHGKAYTRIYETWSGIKRRTSSRNRKNRKDYKHYKNVGMCEEWKNDFESFYKWAMDNGYEENLTIDRIDNNKGYSPDNCRWATPKMQSNNKSDNHIITYKGEAKTISEWAEITNIEYQTLFHRIKNGWSVEKAFTTPIRKRKI